MASPSAAELLAAAKELDLASERQKGKKAYWGKWWPTYRYLREGGMTNECIIDWLIEQDSSLATLTEKQRASFQSSMSQRWKKYQKQLSDPS